jgi:hypothetical protein
VAEDVEPSCGGVMAEEPVVVTSQGTRGYSGRKRGSGGKILSRHPTPYLRAELDDMPESAATIQMPERK